MKQNPKDNEIKCQIALGAENQQENLYEKMSSEI